MYVIYSTREVRVRALNIYEIQERCDIYQRHSACPTKQKGPLYPQNSTNQIASQWLFIRRLPMLRVGLGHSKSTWRPKFHIKRRWTSGKYPQGLAGCQLSSGIDKIQFTNHKTCKRMKIKHEIKTYTSKLVYVCIDISVLPTFFSSTADFKVWKKLNALLLVFQKFNAM